MITKPIDELGRIGIPKPLLKTLGINGRTEMQIDIIGEKIVLTKAENICKWCGTQKEIIKGFPVCRSCAQKVSDILNLK